MNIEILKIASSELLQHPAYIAGNLQQTERICELIGTTNTVWSQDEIDALGRRAAAGEFDMHTDGWRVTISFKQEAATEDVPPVTTRTPFTDEELVTLFEVARVSLGNAGWFSAIAEELDLTEEALGEVRNKLEAIMDSDVPILGQQTIVLELIENSP